MTNNTVCECGRVGIHCPQCGSRNLAGKASLRRAVKINVDGQTRTVEIGVYRCRRCGVQFDDIDWSIRCEASPRMARPQEQQTDTTTPSKSVRVSDLTQNERQSLLKTLFDKETNSH